MQLRALYILLFFCWGPLSANQPSLGYAMPQGKKLETDTVKIAKIEKQTEQVKTLSRLSFIIPFLGSVIGIVAIVYALILIRKIKRMEENDPGKKKILLRYLLLASIAVAFWLFACYSLILIL